MGRHLTRWLIPLPAIVLAFWPTVVSAIEVPPNPYYNAPQNLTTEPAANNGITVKWDVPEVSNYDRIDIYVIEFYKLTNGVESGGWAVWTDAENHAYTLGSWIYNYTGENARFKVKAGSDACVGRPDPIGYCLYGEKGSVDAVINNPATTTTSSTTTTTSSTTSTSTTTTTTTSPSTTTTSTTTTLPQETTTTTEPVQSTTTTSVADTTTTTTTTEPPAPTTTQAPYTPPQTTTTIEPVVTTTSSTTTTTSLPEPSTTVEETSTTTQPSTTTTEPATTTTESTTTSTAVPVEPDPTVPVSRPVPSSVAPTLPAETSTPTSQPSPETSIQETLPPVVESSSTTTLPEIKLGIVADQPISDAKVEQILEVLAEAAPAQIVAAIEQVLATNITSDQAVSIASSPEVLAAVTEEQAEAIFEQIVVEELTLEVAEELVAVLNEAPTKVKKAFQETVDVFAGVFDSFQMVGQTIPVGERRTLVAVSNTLVAVGASLRRRDK